MTFTINAWLDKEVPELSVIEIETGNVVARWAGVALSRLFSNGVISYSELNQIDKVGLKRLVKRLILQYASEQMAATGVKDIN
ncbi:MAG: hypothetical protein HWE16_13915 [Gammaproteobacteria bacterium]|nr:hypothetical protein [Gammaproteobacteria bacterium]